MHSNNFKRLYNMTASYRTDSTIVTPYKKWHYDNETVDIKKQSRNFAIGKTKQVAWFVSHCKTPNNRLQYAEELQKFISVDIFGECGTKKCPRNQQRRCFKMLNKEYKFYLAFENSNCIDYITEKFFINGLSHDVIPIVMGARHGCQTFSSCLKPHLSLLKIASYYIKSKQN